MLHAVRRRLAGELRELPAILALHGAQQPPHIRQRAAPRLGARKPPPHPRTQRRQPVRPVLHRRDRSRRSFGSLLAHDYTSLPWYSHRILATTTAVVLGRVWLIEMNGEAVGYAILTLGYSL